MPRALLGMIAVCLAGQMVSAATVANAAGVVPPRVSVATTGEQGDRHSYGPSVNDDGRFVAFTSYATTLVPSITGTIEAKVFVRDRLEGQTELISVPTGSSQGSEGLDPSISSDGRFVAFFSGASDLVAGDTNGNLDVFVRDRVAGTTERVSLTNGGEQGSGVGVGDSYYPAISGDGRYVAFTSTATNLVPGDTNQGPNNGIDVFVRDRVAGTTERVSVTSDEAQADEASSSPSISADGRYVAFLSYSPNLVPGGTRINKQDVFVRDRTAGTTERVSVDSNGSEFATNSFASSMSADGRYVAFSTDDTVYVRDLVLRTTEVLAQGGSSAISSTGRFVAFDSRGALVPSDTNATSDVYVRDRQSGTTTRVSEDDSGGQADGSSVSPGLSADGLLVAFDSVASNLVPGDTNGVQDVFAASSIGRVTPSDAAAPAITFSSPPDGASYTLNQSVSVNYSCADEAGGSGVATCAGAIDGNPVANGPGVPTDSAGTHTFVVSASDVAGNVRTETHTYTVLAGSTSQAVSGGDTVTTDPGSLGATTDVPVQTAISVPNGVSGTLSITLQDASGSSPAGYSFFNKDVVLSGPTAFASAPYQVTFSVDASLLGAVGPADLQIFRNGTVVSDCTDVTAAIPDPCVASRATGVGGDAIITVRTSAFSTWNVGALHYTLSAFAAPILAPPGVNNSTAGNSVPLRFSLGGNRGLDIFASGYPRSTGYTCGGALPAPSAGTATSGALTYDTTKNTYTYTWKTTKTWKGCRQIALRFRDGTLRTLRFTFK